MTKLTGRVTSEFTGELFGEFVTDSYDIALIYTDLIRSLDDVAVITIYGTCETCGAVEEVYRLDDKVYCWSCYNSKFFPTKQSWEEFVKMIYETRSIEHQ